MRRLREVQEAAPDQGLVPFRAVLIVEAQQVAVFIHPRGKARAGEQHEGEQRVAARSLAGGMGDEQRCQPDGLAAQFLAQQARADGRLVTFVEEQVQRREDAVEPVGPGRALGEIETDIGIADTLFRARELFFDRGFAAHERVRDLGGAEAAQDLQREDDLGLGRDRRVAAYEHEPQAVIADFEFVVRRFGRDRRFGGGLFEVSDDGGLFGEGQPLVAHRVFCEIHRDPRDPGRGIRGEPADGPGAQRAHHCLLRHVFDQGEILRPEQARERTVQASGFVAKKMIDQLGRTLGSRQFVGCDFARNRRGTDGGHGTERRKIARTNYAETDSRAGAGRPCTPSSGQAPAMGRTSTLMPMARLGQRWAISVASSRSATVRRKYPPIASFASANGPSTTRSPRGPETTRPSGSRG